MDEVLLEESYLYSGKTKGRLGVGYVYYPTFTPEK